MIFFLDKKYKDLAKFTQKFTTTHLKGVKPAQFIEALENLNVNVIIDVRFWNIYPLYYHPKNMKDLLEIHGIEYKLFQKLGNPSELRKRAGNNFLFAKRLYQDFIQNKPEPRKQFLELFKLSRFNKTYCLICYCPTNDPKLCHRFWLKELLINYKRMQLGLSGYIEIQNLTQKLIPEVI